MKKNIVNQNYKVQGHIDQLNGGLISGWAFDPNEPNNPAQVALFVGQSLIAKGKADMYRSDLKALGIGNGRHGYNFRLKNILPIGKPLTITLQCNGQRVETARLNVTIESNYSATLHEVKDQRLTGYIKPTTEQWQTELIYHVFVDDTKIAQQSTCFDEINQTYPIGCPLPGEYFDGLAHLLSIYLDGTARCLATLVAVLQPITTPWEHLATSSSVAYPIYAGLPSLVARRLTSFQAQISSLAEKSAIKEIQNLDLALRVLNQGHEKRKAYSQLSLPHPTTYPDISIIIPAHNKFALTYHCIASLILSSNQCSYEVILADDCSNDKTTEVKSFITNIKVIVNETNLGFLRNCNKAAQQAKGRYLVLLNNDTEVGDGWLDEMLAVFDRYQKVGAVGAKLLNGNGSLQEAGGIVWDNGQPENLGSNGNPYAPEWNYARQCDYLSGAALMVPKTLWDSIGGLSDEYAPCYYEDTDLAFKVRAAGYRTFYCPHAEVIHFEGQTHGTNIRAGFKKYQAINAPKFAAKWVEAYTNNGRMGTDLWRNKERGVRFRCLVIDYCTPEPDKNAGAYAAVQEMRLLQAHGFKLTFIPENLAHFGHYTRELQKMGVECIHAPFYVSVEDLLLKRGQEFDLVFITRYSVAERYLNLIKQHSRAKILFNNADLHFLRELRSALSRSDKNLSTAISTRDSELALMNQVDAILSYNEAEHAVITSHILKDDNIFKCPWVLPAHGHKTPYEKRQGIAFLGGYRHPPNVEAVEFFIAQVLPLLRAQRTDIPFHIFGSHPPDSFYDYEAEGVIVEGFVETLDAVFEHCRLFIAPLTSGAGIKGKVLEAMSWGVPSVLSPVAAEATGLTNGISAAIAETPEEWVEAIIKLYDDPALWQKYSENSLSLAQHNYSFEHGWKLMGKPLAYLGFFGGKAEGYAVAKTD